MTMSLRMDLIFMVRNLVLVWEESLENLSARVLAYFDKSEFEIYTDWSIWKAFLSLWFPGILISIRLSLGLSGQVWLRPGAFRDDWWEAHLSLSMLTLMFAVLFTLFPKKMPNSNIEKPDETGIAPKSQEYLIPIT